jgi:hypothetical protein
VLACGEGGAVGYLWNAPAGLTCLQPVHCFSVTLGLLDGRVVYHFIMQSLHQEPRPQGLLRLRWNSDAGLFSLHCAQTLPSWLTG